MSKHTNPFSQRNMHQLDADLEFIPDTSPTPDQEVISAEQRAIFYQTFNEMIPKYRDVLVLQVVSGWSIADIAGHYETAWSTIKSRIQTAQSDFIRKFEEHGGDVAAISTSFLPETSTTGVAIAHAKKWEPQS